MIKLYSIYDEEIWVNVENVTHLRNVTPRPDRKPKYDGPTTQLFYMNKEFSYVKGTPEQVASQLNVFWDGWHGEVDAKVS